VSHVHTSHVHHDNITRPFSPRPPKRLPVKGKSKVPSFDGLRPASPTSSKAKRENRATGTIQEELLRRSLRDLGLHYRKNLSKLPGKPDIVFPSAHTIVFCDGDFWHGRHWPRLKRKLRRGTNSQYWVAKIRTNMRRDTATTAELESMGWKVLRIWERDILHDSHCVALRIKRIVESRSGSKAVHH
jgi:DNA mismatch endonuclease, patch repair protein